MTPILTNLGRVLNALGRLRCRLLGHHFGALDWMHRRFRDLHRSMDCDGRCARCGVRCVEVQ